MKAKELKVTDLMVGDWVICYHPTRLKSFEKVSVGLLHIMQEQEYGHIKEDSPLFRIVEPIPLTPKILEKNGFENIDNKYPFPTFRCDDKENYLCITIGFPKEDKTKRKRTFIEIDGIHIYIGHLITNFVHELQHLLRLCKIDKEIVV